MAVPKKGWTERRDQLARVRRHAWSWTIVIQQTPTPTAGLRALPDTFFQNCVTDNNNQNVQMQFQQQMPALNDNNNNFQVDDGVDDAKQTYLNAARAFGEFTDKIIRIEAARDVKHDRQCKLLQEHTQKMAEFLEAFKEKTRAKEQRLAEQNAIDSELKLVGSGAIDPHFNWMIGHGVCPKAVRKGNKSLSQFDRLTTSYRSNSLWFIQDAEPYDLSPPFIEFIDYPRISIDGESIRALLAREEDVSDLLAKALVRLLRKDESTRDKKKPQGECHYVMHTWAHTVLTAGFTIQDCEEEFKLPRSYYAFAGCKKVVAMVALPDGWASLSMDFKVAVASLIHPAVANQDPAVTMQRNIGWMTCLTIAAQDHLKKLGRVEPPKKEWEFCVPLQGGLPIDRKDSGIAMAFYSIPKDQQFSLVSEETLLLAKQTFIYNLMRMTFKITKQKIRKATKKTEFNRDSNGRFISIASDGHIVDEQGGDGGSEGESNCQTDLAM